MPSDTATAYLRTKVLTASPEQLRMMLLEGAIKFTRQGREALSAKDYEGIYTGFSRARNIVVELITAIRPDTEATLRARIQGLYAFIFQQLVDAAFERDAAKADKAIELLEFERETWRLAMQKAASERHGAPANVPEAVPTAERPALSLQG